MIGQKLRRFWTAATVAEAPEGFEVQLDGRRVRTPAKAVLRLPNRALAEAVAAEWQAQEREVDPGRMPVTRAANAAIDKVATQRDAVQEMLADYADCDLTCYRAEAPEELVARQAAAWDPLLDWAHETYGARLVPVQGVVHQPQDPRALSRLTAELAPLTDFQLTAMHDLVSVSGSLVIGLAAARALLPAPELWRRSRIDEDWQIEQWGHDDEADATEAAKAAAFLQAAKLYEMAS